MSNDTSTFRDNPVFFYYFFWVFVFLILALIIISVVFSRDTIPATTITDRSWSGKEERLKELKFLPKSQQLLHIWSQVAENLPAEQVIKGGTETYQRIQGQFDAIAGTFTKNEHNRGIVIAAEGFSYLTDAYVLVRELRHTGCTLPIEIWSRDIQPNYAQCMAEWGAICLNLDEHITFEVKHKHSFKVLAMYLSSFREIIYLDADNNLLFDPTFLFTTPEYQQHETLFWPDFWALNASAPCYLNFPAHITPQLPVYQQDSGQLVIHKKRYEKQLWCIFQIFENDLTSLFPTPFNENGKDLFHTTWSATGQSFTFVSHRPAAVATHYINKALDKIQSIGSGQSAPDGRLLFVHQNHLEWFQKSYTKQEPAWIILKYHTHPTLGSVESGTWNLEGPTRTELFRETVGTIEDVYMGFLNDLRRQAWYQNTKVTVLKNI